ncbi:MAG: hypothetical protein Q4G05_01950 [Clostridia bacterium]|nr:hypothetical protein [Clostridia bacterium]
MKDIIIMGTGKAALLHYNSYKKNKVEGEIFFVDIKNEGKKIHIKNIYTSIKECITLNNLKSNNLIIDICTPKSEFFKILDICKQLGIVDVLVEKPFVIDEQIINKYENLNIVMVENYLYSKISIFMKKYINDNKKEIDLIYTNFSKNRVMDSFNGRGCVKEVPLNFEIEMPHQVYLAQYFLDNPREVINNISCSRDMIFDNKILKNHGFGLIISKYKDISIIHESDLTSNITQKKIIICTKDNFVIEGNYAIYSNDLRILKPANVKIYNKGKLIYSEIMVKDDNFTYFIKEVYSFFNGKSNNPNIVDIKTFSKLMKIYYENL